MEKTHTIRESLSIRITVFLFASLLLSFQAHSQEHKERLQAIDIEHYTFSILLNNTSDEIHISAEIKFRSLKDLEAISLDLVGQDEDGKGMKISRAEINTQRAEFEHKGELVSFFPKQKLDSSSTNMLLVEYKGIPKDGLIISKNKFDQRTFFADNWPDRAHNWLICVDHPSDKAGVSFSVQAPSEYQVISNGIQIEETVLENGDRLTVWSETHPIPMKVTVIGAAPFAVRYSGETHDIPVSAWVFSENKEQGFYDYAQAVEVLDYFVSHVGAYPFDKLANVQSKTRYGGMENASAIFYFENSVVGDRSHEDLIAHEIAHQWFGNSATEANWHHIWLSEGFATYFTDLYLEHKYGVDYFRKRMNGERKKVLSFGQNIQAPVIDQSVTDYNRLLNPNSYQKGAWILHMLRREIGDEAFWKGIRTYYRKHQYANATTEDLENSMEESSAEELDWFFDQWLRRASNPSLELDWKQNGKKLEIELSQTQEMPYQLTLELLLKTNEEEELLRLDIDRKTEKFKFDIPFSVDEIIIDPYSNLLASFKVNPN